MTVSSAFETCSLKRAAGWSQDLNNRTAGWRRVTLAALLHGKAGTVNALPIESLIRLRLAVGYLGEQHQAGWWQSSFLSSAGRTFLTFSFAKTLPLAQYSGVTAAAGGVEVR